MTLNSSGIRDIQRVLGISIVCILAILRPWFTPIAEPVVSGHYKRVEIDEMWTFVQMSGEYTKRIFQAKKILFLRKKPRI